MRWPRQLGRAVVRMLSPRLAGDRLRQRHPLPERGRHGRRCAVAVNGTAEETEQTQVLCTAERNRTNRGVVEWQNETELKSRQTEEEAALCDAVKIEGGGKDRVATVRRLVQGATRL